jgi:hypothetical protein
VKHEDVNGEEFSKRRLGHLQRKLGVIPVVVNSFSEVPEVLGSLYKDALKRDLPDRRDRPASLELEDETRAPRQAVSDKRRRRPHQYTVEQSWTILHEMRDGKLPTTRPPGVEHWWS